LVVYHDGTVLKITYVVIGLLASLAPILSIWVLTKMHTMRARLWTIAGFNVGIALSLQLFTEAKRTDIFSVTAA
jgi:putative flippase GtrA